VEEVARIVKQIRERWPHLRFLVVPRRLCPGAVVRISMYQTRHLEP
jgi:hypothetical protein